jgi:alpha-beta hydrolase superfamily lysophospholipase
MRALVLTVSSLVGLWLLHSRKKRLVQASKEEKAGFLEGHAEELGDVDFTAVARTAGRGGCSVWSSGAGGGRYKQHLHWWMPEGEAAGTIFLFHGMHEHAGRYDHVAREFSKHGFSVFAPDLKGHGLSDGGRGEVDSFDDYIEDGLALIDAVDAAQGGAGAGGRRLFLLGHSMGGAVAVRIAQLRPTVNARTKWAGLILSAPGLGVGVEAGHGLLLAALSALRPLAPNAPLPPFDPAQVRGSLTHSPLAPALHF